VVEGGADAPRHQAVFPASVEIGEQDGDRLPDQPATVHNETEAAKSQPRMFEVKQLRGGQVHSNLLVVPFPAGRRAFI
jgi:hypothetical protein